MDQVQRDAFLQRYMAMWHEPDPARRRAIVESLFAEDAENVTQRSVNRGVAEVCARVTRAYDEWVAQKGFVFRSAERTAEHHGIIKFVWHMVPRAGGKVDSIGLDVMVLGPDGRIRTLYQFAEPAPAS
jgi:hypothetical protein